MHNLVVGTLNCTGTVYKGHFDVWLINHLQLQIEATQHLIPEGQRLTGWTNGDLYIPAGERIGILPVPDSIRVTADIETYHAEDGQFKHAFLAQQQGTKYAVVAIHTTAEKALFKKLRQENPLFNQRNSVTDWKQASKFWNREANGQEIFYKVCLSICCLALSIYEMLLYSWLSICRLIIINGFAISMRRFAYPRPLLNSRLLSRDTALQRGLQLHLQLCSIKFPS